MKRGVWLLCALTLLAALAGARAAGAANVPPVFVVHIDGAIGPASAEYVTGSLERAAREHAQLVVRRLDTPGGLDTAMRGIIKAILASPTPVAVYVSPLATAQATVVTLEPDWRGRLLAVVSEPGLVLILLMIGVYGLLFEFMNPGFVAPGVMGGVCLLLALWGLQMLPVNYAGLGLILLGIGFFVAEAFVPSYGALGMGGIAGFGFGAVLLFDSDAPGFGIPPVLVGALTVVSAAFVIGVASMAAKARRRPVVSGLPNMIGGSGEVIEFGAGEGWALVGGERWHVRAAQLLRPGQPVRITAVDGLTLEVSPAAEPAATPGVSR